MTATLVCLGASVKIVTGKTNVHHVNGITEEKKIKVAQGVILEDRMCF